LGHPTAAVCEEWTIPAPGKHLIMGGQDHTVPEVTSMMALRAHVRGGPDQLVYEQAGRTRRARRS